MGEDTKAYYKQLLQRDRTKLLEEGARKLAEGLAIYATAAATSELEGNEVLALLQGEFMKLSPVARRNTNRLQRKWINALGRVLFFNFNRVDD